MLNVSLQIEDKDFDTLKKMLEGFKDTMSIIDVYDIKHLQNMIEQGREEYKNGKTITVTDEEMDYS